MSGPEDPGGLPPSGTARLALWGPDHVGDGEVRTVALGPALGAAISRGAGPKARPSTDPNEDVAAVAAGPGRSLLVVADGHGGADAAVGAVDHLLSTFDPLPWVLPAPGARELLAAAGSAAAAAAGRGGRSRSETTLVVALLSGPDLWWASTGDSGLFLVDTAGPRRLDRPSRRYAGASSEPADVAAGGDVGRVPLEEGAWVCLVTDGYLDYAHPGPEEALAAVLAGPPADAAAGAAALVERALAGGAGDNVAVALGRA